LDLAEEVYHIREPEKLPLVMSADEIKRLLAVASSLKTRVLDALCPIFSGMNIGASYIVSFLVSKLALDGIRMPASNFVQPC
jgi:hypothetical protein